jgi:parallel beta-helix repeat protein
LFSSNNTLSGNLMNYCGIFLEGSLVEMASHSIDNTNLVNNKPVYYYTNQIGLGASSFTDAGQIILIDCNNSIISGLNLSNGTTGIHLGYSNNNTLSGNIINNNAYGILLDSNSKNNKIFLNNFTNNEIDAEDNGLNNLWDNGVIGNYWDDYDGIDANDDGIGDTPYRISGTAGSQDNFPIWADGDEEIPEVPIISFGNYYILFMFITILSFIILEKQKKK